MLPIVMADAGYPLKNDEDNANILLSASLIKMFSLTVVQMGTN